MSGSDAPATNAYWGRDGLEEKILDALAAAGKNVDSLTIDDLAPADQFHGGGKGATERLARLAALKPGTRVLDVGGGLGGPARTLAGQFGCRVAVVDLTESYVRTGAALTARLGLADRVTHRVGDALALDEPMAGPVQPVVFPVMWARDASASFLRAPDAMRALIEAAGFQVRAWDDVTDEVAGPGSAAAIPAHSVQRIIMGEALDAIVRAGQQNRADRRIVMTQAVLERRAAPASAPSPRTSG